MWQLGGDYREFYDFVKHYFEELEKLKIEAYVVIDGVDQDHSKEATYRDRCERRIEQMCSFFRQEATCSTQHTIVSPLFTKMVFIDALRDTRVKFFVADGEADSDIVSLANHLECPVLGRDSDFFIFNVKEGYVPMDNSYDLSKELKCFSFKLFDAQYSLRDHDLRLALPIILGNDYSDRLLTRRLQKYKSLTNPTGLFKEVLADVRMHSSLDTFVEQYGVTLSTDRHDPSLREEVTSRLKKTLQFYRKAPCPPRPFSALSTSKCLVERYPHIPVWIFDAYKRSEFMTDLMYFLLSGEPKMWGYCVVVEDTSQPGAWEITTNVRKCLMGVLVGAKRDVLICETVRVRCTAEICSQHLVEGKAKLLKDQNFILDKRHQEIVTFPLVDIKEMPVLDLQMVILNVFECNDIDEQLEWLIPEHLRLAVIVSHYWLKNSPRRGSDYQAYVLPLVLCFLSCCGEREMPKSDSKDFVSVQDSLTFVHAFAQWQCVLHHTLAFNQLLHQPYTYTSPGRLFSGSVLKYYYLNKVQVTDRLVIDMVDLIRGDTVT